VYLKEKEHLAEIKDYEFECCRAEHKTASSLSRVHFEWNWYSVPEEYVSKQLLVKGYVAEVVISCEGKEIARHTREFGRNKFIYIPHHYLGTLERKPGAIRNGIPFKDWNLPEVFEDYRKLLKRHYKDSDKIYVKTLVLLKTWSLEEVTEAIKISISSGVVGDSYILSLLKNTEEPVSESELKIRAELNSYKAEQQSLEDYDKFLLIKRSV
jgi:hypothetical protein